jgi:hypothetical protein
VQHKKYPQVYYHIPLFETDKVADWNSSPVVEEVQVFSPVSSYPLINLCVKQVAMGTSHSAAVTGIYISTTVASL